MLSCPLYFYLHDRVRLMFRLVEEANNKLLRLPQQIKAVASEALHASGTWLMWGPL